MLTEGIYSQIRSFSCNFLYCLYRTENKVAILFFDEKGYVFKEISKRNHSDVSYCYDAIVDSEENFPFKSFVKPFYVNKY